MLLGRYTDASACEPLTERPDDFERELSELQALIRDAVNAASRRATTHGEPPLECIAAYLIQSQEEVDETMPIDADEMSAVLTTAAALAMGTTPLADGSATMKQADLLGAFKSGKTHLQQALASRGSSGSQKQPTRPGRRAMLPASAMKPSSDDQLGPRQRRPRPKAVLGKTASSIFPTVIGTFQEYASNKAKREVDQSVLAAAARAPVVKALLDRDLEETSYDDEQKAIRALGQS